MRKETSLRGNYELECHGSRTRKLRRAEVWRGALEYCIVARFVRHEWHLRSSTTAYLDTQCLLEAIALALHEEKAGKKLSACDRRVALQCQITQ